MDIANRYFGKSSSWIYNKIYQRDINGNGKLSKFTPEEIEILKGALLDISNRLKIAADKL